MHEKMGDVSGAPERIVQSAVGESEPESVCLMDREERERIPFGVLCCFVFNLNFFPNGKEF